MAASSLKSTPKPVGSLEIIAVSDPFHRWEIYINDRRVGAIEKDSVESVFIVFDRSYLGKAYGQQRYFYDLVGRKNATFSDLDEAKKFIAKQLKKYPDPPKKSDYLRQAANN